MAVTSSWRTLIPHTKSKSKAPQLLALESLTNGRWFIKSSLPEIFPVLPHWHCKHHPGHATSLRACTRLLAISTTGCVLKRPEDESPTLQKPDFVNSQSLRCLEESCSTIRFFLWCIQWHYAWDKLKYWEKTVSQLWNSPSHSGIAIPSSKNSIWVRIRESPSQK